ncbi:hypothetical protein MMC32_007412 [Xylographa parallela]|nr:hypothetical protein [Xylographa parallela]
MSKWIYHPRNIYGRWNYYRNLLPDVNIIDAAAIVSVQADSSRGFLYSTTYSTIDYFTVSQSLLFAGCVSTYATGSGLTTVTARSGDSQLSRTVITGPVTMWGQAVTVEYQQQDLSLFPSATTAFLSPTSTMASPSAGSSTQPISTPGASPTVATESILTLTASAPASTTSATQSTVSSTGSQVGIGIGVAVAFILLLSIAVILFKRRRKQSRYQSAPVEVFEVEADQQHTDKTLITEAYQGGLLEAPEGELGPQELHGEHMSIKGRHVGVSPG